MAPTVHLQPVRLDEGGQVERLAHLLRLELGLRRKEVQEKSGKHFREL
jgi:hypothetical protein